MRPDFSEPMPTTRTCRAGSPPSKTSWRRTAVFSPPELFDQARSLDLERLGNLLEYRNGRIANSTFDA